MSYKKPRNRKGHPALLEVVPVTFHGPGFNQHKSALRCTAFYEYRRPRVVFWVATGSGDKVVLGILQKENLRRLCQAFIKRHVWKRCASK